MTLLCVSLKRSRLLPEVFDERSLALRMLSPRERVNVFGTGGTVRWF